MKDKDSVRHRGMARVVFLANEAKFRALIAAGYPLKEIYREHADALGIGYPHFTRYVNRYLLDAVLHQRKRGLLPLPPSVPRATASSPGSVSSDSPSAPRKPQNTPAKSTVPFHHNPGSNDRDDLI